MSERVTWLLPVKNGMPYLPETLASIERQTYRNWEVLAWDNNSSDGTLAELHQWIPARLSGTVVADAPLSLGLSLARMVEVAGTELCARIDADDINEPERLARQVAYLQAHPQVGVVGAAIEFIDEQGRMMPGAWDQPLTDAEIRWRLRWKNSLNHPTVLFRRSIVLAAGNYRDCMPYEDYDLWFRVGLLAELANLPEKLVRYRLTGASVTAAVSRDYETLSNKVAEGLADKMFGGLDADAALALRRKARLGSSESVELWDIIRLRRAATASALAVGKPASYFRRTELFAVQQREMLSRWLDGHALGRAGLRLKRKLRARLAATRVL